MLKPLLFVLSLSLSPALAQDEASIRAAIVKDRVETQEWLKSDPQSYLAAIKRVDFADKSVLTVGAAEDNDLRLATLSPHHLRITLQGEKFHVEAVDPAASFTIGKATPTVSRSALLDPAPLFLGRYSLRLSHQGYPALIVFDRASPRYKEYHGLNYFPIDLDYRFVAPLIPDPAAATVAIASTHSADRKANRVGWFEFKIGGKVYRLAVNRILEPGSTPDTLMVLFRDATTGKESYSVGRYVTPVKQANGAYVLDFNMAFNPACAISPHYNCPIPPKENYLQVAIRAGERDPKYH